MFTIFSDALQEHQQRGSYTTLRYADDADYDQDIKLAGPADIAVLKMSDGSYLLVIPELSATSPNNHDNPVTVTKLPANFDRF